MKQRRSTGLVAALAVAILVVVSGISCVATDGPRDTETGGSMASRGKGATIILAQWNPCPNGRCR